jgi:hypothetical protein
MHVSQNNNINSKKSSTKKSVGFQISLNDISVYHFTFIIHFCKHFHLQTGGPSHKTKNTFLKILYYTLDI